MMYPLSLSQTLTLKLTQLLNSKLNAALLWRAARNSLKMRYLLSLLREGRSPRYHLGRGRKNWGRWTRLVSWLRPARGTSSSPALTSSSTSPSSSPTGRSTWRPPASRSLETVRTCQSFQRCSRRTSESPGGGNPSQSCDCWESGVSSEWRQIIKTKLPKGSKRFIERGEEIHYRSSFLLRLCRQFPVTGLDSIFFHG